MPVYRRETNMSDWDEDENYTYSDNAPESDKLGPTYKLTIEGLPKSAIMDAVLERVARDVAGQITNDQRREFRAQVFAKLDEVVAKIADARLEKEINSLINEGWQPCDRWGKPCGPKQNLRDLVTAYLMTNVDQHGRKDGDNYSDRDKRERVYWFVEKAVNGIFDKEIKHVIDKFRTIVRDKFDAKLAAEVAETLKSAIGLR